MKTEFFPYYLSRAALSALFAILVLGFTWKAAVATVSLFGLFLLYLHSGWFQVDPKHPLSPLRRDERGRQIQRNALIAAVTVGILIYLILTLVPSVSGSSIIAGSLVLASGILTYFITQFILFARA
jgi:hypothetical protein